MSESRQVVGGNSYFELPRKQRQSSSSYEEVSPFSAPISKTAFPRKRLHRPHLGYESRSHSDSIFLRSRFTVIEEGVATHHSSPSRTPELSETLDEAPKQTARSNQLNSSSSQSWDHTPRPNTPKPNQVLQSNTPSTGSSSGRIRQTRPALRSLNTASITKFPNDTSSSTYDTASLRDKRKNKISARVASLPIQPLPPPSISTRYSEPLPEHSVKIEQSFTDSLVRTSHKSRIEPGASRRSSINPKHIFSISVDAFRRKGKKSLDPTTSLLEGQLPRNQMLSTAAPDHQTSLRRQQTGFGLARVTSMLQEIKKLDLKTQPLSERTPTVSPNFTAMSPGHDAPMSHHFRDRVRSMEISIEDTDSHSSSLARMRLGPVPNNTPEEKATYTIINQDGKLEDFLKVDISIRGQTSYLPSEARRIHTPPLPAEGRDGRQRGFFFDYAMAKDSDIHGTAAEQGQEGQSTEGKRNTSNLSFRPSHASAASRRSVPLGADNGAKAKTGDWYEMQLAKFESLSYSESPSLSPQLSAHDDHVVSSFEQEQQRLENEKQLDHNIPEHLPTSPLCPRHPRYWRVVKNKGSQFRGC